MKKNRISFYDNIVHAVQEKYRKVSSSKNKKNESNNWTVLAGIVVYNVDTNEISVVSLATGTDCLSEKKRDMDGMLIVDSHAEVLCHRAFKRWVLLEILNQNSKYFVKTQEEKLSMKSGFQIALYSSQSPCGDCSMESLAADNIISMNENQKINCKIDGYVLRGRMHYECLGVLRTKPGRADSELSQSHSCSDKLAKLFCLGLGGSFVRYHFVEPIRVKIIIIEDRFHRNGLERGLNERTVSWRNKYGIKPIEFSKTDLVFEEGCQIDKLSSSVSKIWMLGMDRAETINMGRKQGFIKPKNNSWPAQSSSMCSKYHLGRLFLETIKGNPQEVSYSQLKALSIEYQMEKRYFLLESCFKGWKQSDKDMFENFRLL